MKEVAIYHEFHEKHVDGKIRKHFIGSNIFTINDDLSSSSNIPVNDTEKSQSAPEQAIIFRELDKVVSKTGATRFFQINSRKSYCYSAHLLFAENGNAVSNLAKKFDSKNGPEKTSNGYFTTGWKMYCQEEGNSWLPDHLCCRYICSVCERVLSTKSSLKRHALSHVGELPFKCEKCPLRYTKLSALKNHRCLSNNNNWCAAVMCNVCQKTFINKNFLKGHVCETQSVGPQEQQSN